MEAERRRLLLAYRIEVSFILSYDYDHHSLFVSIATSIR
jgi:hypothetical protein